GLGGWPLFLDANKNGMFDAGERTTTSTATGTYSFAGLLPATYRVREMQKSGWRETAPLAGYFDVVVAPGAIVTGKNFGNTQKARLSGTVFNDVNVNGVRDAGEVGFGAWTLY